LRVREDDVKDLLARACGGNLLDQAGLGVVRPGPRTHFAQAAFVDIDHNQAALVNARRAQSPDQVATALLQLIEELGGKKQQRRTDECGEP
jgi:hypothetical protein